MVGGGTVRLLAYEGRTSFDFIFVGRCSCLRVLLMGLAHGWAGAGGVVRMRGHLSVEIDRSLGGMDGEGYGYQEGRKGLRCSKRKRSDGGGMGDIAWCLM